MRRALSLLAIIGLLLSAGCSSTQCNVAQRALATAQTGYEMARATGITSKVDQYWWAVNAAQAMVVFWCAETPTEE